MCHRTKTYCIVDESPSLPLDEAADSWSRAAGWCNVGCLTTWQCLCVGCNTKHNQKDPVIGATHFFSCECSGLCHCPWGSRFAVGECAFYDSAISAFSPLLGSLQHLTSPLSHIFSHILITMWPRHTVSIICNKKDGAWIGPHMELGWCLSPVGP